MAEPNKPIELFFRDPIYARGEHVIGKDALTDDGKINMVRIERGTVIRFQHAAARDLIISRQAIDNRNSRPEDRADAKAYVEERNRAENPEAKKKAA